MFSKTSEYALRAAVWLGAAPNESATAQRIAEATKVPVGYMSKVMHALVKAGVVTSQRGPTGGFTLMKHPDQLTAYDVVSALEPVSRLKGCPLELPEHSMGLCPMHGLLDQIAATAEEMLKSKTITSLLAEATIPLGHDRICRGGTCEHRCGALGAGPCVTAKLAAENSNSVNFSMVDLTAQRAERTEREKVEAGRRR
jgi:Rrf2 family transcriptional regulator, nitric oxide-sensitive transcriptional repressor